MAMSGEGGVCLSLYTKKRCAVLGKVCAAVLAVIGSKRRRINTGFDWVGISNALQ